VLDAFVRDFRYALRGLRRAPMFTTIAVLTVALGVGANSAIFSLVHGIAIAPMPYPQPDRLVRVWHDTWLTMGWSRTFDSAESFQSLSIFRSASSTLLGHGDPQELPGGDVSAEHFATLGVQPMLGRAFTSEDQAPGAEPVAILSFGLWQRAFGGDSGVVGRIVEVSYGSTPTVRVVGIMPQGHVPLRPGWEYWRPAEIDPEADAPGSSRGCTCWRVVARLAPGVSPGQASAEVAVLARRIQAGASQRMTVETLADAYVVPLLQDTVEGASAVLWILLGAVSLVLLIAVANVANLFLARGESRRREAAIQCAVGAPARRLASRALLESTLVGVAGGLVGLGIAIGLVRIFRPELALVLPRTDGIHLSLPVLAFTFAVSLAAAAACGLLPALGLSRTDPAAVLGTSRGSGGERARRRLKQVLVATEVALAVVLVAGAGLMVRSLQRLRAVDPGIRTTGLLTLRLAPAGDAYRDIESLDRYFDRVVAEVEALPGVESAALIQSLPLSGEGWGWDYTVDNMTLAADEAMPNAGFRVVSDHYFSTLGIPLLAGRVMTNQDRDSGDEVAMVNRSFALRHFGSPQEALDHHITLNIDDDFRIVGVVADYLQFGLDAKPQPEIFRMNAPFPLRPRALIVATAGDPAALTESVRQAIWRVDPSVPLRGVMPMDAVIQRSLAGNRLFLRLFGAFAGLALVLAMVGIYGVLAFLVTHGRRALGVRLALGAPRGHVLLQTVRSGLTPVVAGLVGGLLVSFGATRLLGSLLFEVAPTDPPTYVAVCAVILGTALAACYFPARRAAGVDPLTVLRVE